MCAIAFSLCQEVTILILGVHKGARGSLVKLASRVVEDPSSVAALAPNDARQVLAELLMVTAGVYAKWVEGEQAEQVAAQRADGDRLLPLREIAKRLSCSERTVMRRWEAGLYPFILKDGGRLVGSEDGLGRWIKTQTARRAPA
jgi:hypothetical protein